MVLQDRAVSAELLHPDRPWFHPFLWAYFGQRAVAHLVNEVLLPAPPRRPILKSQRFAYTCFPLRRSHG